MNHLHFNIRSQLNATENQFAIELTA